MPIGYCLRLSGNIRCHWCYLGVNRGDGFHGWSSSVVLPVAVYVGAALPSLVRVARGVFIGVVSWLRLLMHVPPVPPWCLVALLFLCPFIEAPDCQLLPVCSQ